MPQPTSEPIAAAILDSLDCHVALLDEAGTILSVNRAWQQFGTQNGIPAAYDWVGVNYLAVCTTIDQSVESAEHARAVDRQLREVLGGQSQGFSYQYPCHSPDTERWFMLRVCRLVGHRTQFVVSHSDISEPKRAEQVVSAMHRELVEAERRLRALIEGSPHAMLVERGGQVVFANVMARALFGGDLARGLSTIEGRGCGQPFEQPWHSAEGKSVTLEAEAVTILYDGELAKLYSLRDISSRRASEEAIRQFAYHDALTGLPNRRLLLDRLDQAILSLGRSRHFGGLLYLDLDRFKQLNDRFGHDAGDLLLKQVAIRLATCVREVDSVARLGGDEFVVLLDALSANAEEATAQARRVIERIEHTLGQPFVLHPHPTAHCGASIGLTLFTAENPAEQVLQAADAAMYAVKRSRQHLPERPDEPRALRVVADWRRLVDENTSAAEPPQDRTGSE